MELRSRSRSKTPFQTQTFIEAESFEGNNHVSVTRSTRRTTTVRTTTSATGSSSEHLSHESTSTKPIKNKSTKSTRLLYKTSDYSSEEGEFDSYKHISENEKNQIIEDAKRAANGSAEVSALNLYRKAGRYWDKYPKTDYTYSRHSRDRVEIAPGVVQMPNMSRRTIHLSESSTNTESYLNSFSSPNNNDESYKIIRASSSTTQRNIVISTITSVFTSIYTMIYWCFSSVYYNANSTVIYFGKKIHHLASRVMLLDTWLLKKTSSRRKTRALVALCLLPLLFFAAWYLLSSLGSLIYWSYIHPSNQPLAAEEIIILPEQLSTDPHFSHTTEKNIDRNFEQLDTDEIIEKILQSPKIYNIVNNYHNNIKAGQESHEKLFEIINELKQEINKMKHEMMVLQQSKDADLNRIIAQIRNENIHNLARLTRRLNRCCGRQMIDLEPYITQIFTNLLNDPDFLKKQHGLTDWLHTLFLAKNHLEDRLSNLTQNLDISIDNTANKVMEKVITKLSDRRFDTGSITEEQIRKVVQSSLKIYDADKTGLVDYAMEPLGGEVVTTRCTESYHSGTAVISVLGIPVWYPSISPRTVITPGINPGECWAFQNFPGFLVIKLAARVKIEAFSIEHVSRLLVPDGKIDSAPKEFEVWGLNGENDKDPVLIGEFTYDYDGESLQFFTARQPLVFSMVELRIKSNHGNPNYTCLYRFRVHGTLSNEPS